MSHVSAGEAFLYLVLFTALGVSAFSVVELYFNLIELALYDPSNAPALSPEAWARQLRWATARLIVAFPLFLFASWWVARALRRERAEPASPVRRWLTYVAMFLAVCVIIGDFVTLVAYVLAGEATARFLLKVAVVAAAAGAILGYYLWDLSEGRRQASRAVAPALLAVSIAAVLVAVGSGLWLMGSPAEQAARRTDARRVQDLREIARAVDIHFERHAGLPESLAALAASLETPIPMVDPENGGAYEYRPRAGKAFELCARFARPSESVLQDTTWTHGSGLQCFALTAGDERR